MISSEVIPLSLGILDKLHDLIVVFLHMSSLSLHMVCRDPGRDTLNAYNMSGNC